MRLASKIPANWIALALFCAVSGCGKEGQLYPVDHIIADDRNFMVACSGVAACNDAARDICGRQGFSAYDVLEKSDGDEIGEGRGYTIRCRT
jgi:hypothetical protein